MSYLQEQMKLLKFDKRLIEINFKNGSVNQETYKKYLENLEDQADKVEKLNLEEKPESMEDNQSLDQNRGQQSSHSENQETKTDSSGYTFGSGF